MADNTIFMCKHMVGDGYCAIHEEYCHEGPCGESEPIEYAPVRHGRWLVDSRTGINFCSECQTYAVEAETNYCPECGAKMDEEG